MASGPVVGWGAGPGPIVTATAIAAGGVHTLASRAQCSDGLDHDGDGLVDYPADPGCKIAQSNTERTQCQDALDSGGDGKLDFDGGASANHGVALGPPDPQCTQPWRTSERPAPSCGLGAEIVTLLPAIGFLRRRRRAGSPRSRT